MVGRERPQPKKRKFGSIINKLFKLLKNENENENLKRKKNGKPTKEKITTPDEKGSFSGPGNKVTWPRRSEGLLNLPMVHAYSNRQLIDSLNAHIKIVRHIRKYTS